MNNLGVGLLAFVFGLVFIPSALWYYIWFQMKEHRRKGELESE
jgi:hypothetical protein